MTQLEESSLQDSLVSPLDRRLREEFMRLRAAGRDPADSFRGLYIEEEQVAGLLRDQSSERRHPIHAGRVEMLSRLLELDEFDVQVLLACLVPELDPGYATIYAFLQDDISKKRATVDLLLRLFAAPSQRASLRTRFHPLAALFRTALLSLPDGEPRILDVAPAMDERVVQFLLGFDAFEARLVRFARVDSQPPAGFMARATARAIDSLARSGAKLAALVGAPAPARVEAARRFAREAGHRLLVIDVAALLRSETPPAALVRLVFREAYLTSGVTYWAGADRLWAETDRSAEVLAGLEAELEFWPVVCMLGGDAQWEPPPVLAGSPVTRVAMPGLSTHERAECWRTWLSADGLSQDLRVDVDSLAASFRLSAEQIRDAAVVARSHAEVDGRAVERRDLYAGARAVSGKRLSALGQEIVPRAGWAELILPHDATTQLRELCSTVRQRTRVLEEWGFGTRLNRGAGVTALFTGLSGTGKTMAAEVVAGDLGLALFRIDLAGIVSKWIGETEKNLDRVFEAASDSNAILFFDEADALFGKRSEVKDSHDRYANLEISYLLQKMETYDGVAILATNMRQQLDEAFLRRLTFTVVFPVPDVDDRERIWRAVWPSALPRDDDVDLARVARLKLAGGNIQNVVLAAAHLAAADDRSVGMGDLIQAIRREYQKMGKTMPEDEIFAAMGD